MDIKIKKEVWAVHSEEFGGYDYVSPEGFGYNVDCITECRPVVIGGELTDKSAPVVRLWTINANGKSLYRYVNIYEFEKTWRLR